MENSFGLLQMAPGVKDNSYFILEPQKEYSPIQHNRLEVKGIESKENLQQGRTEVKEGTSNKVVIDSNDTYCTIDEVADAIRSSCRRWNDGCFHFASENIVFRT